MNSEVSSNLLLHQSLRAWERGLDGLRQFSNLNPLKVDSTGAVWFGERQLFHQSGGLHVLAIGKCAAHLALAVTQRLGDTIVGGFIVGESNASLGSIWMSGVGGHPVPNLQSLATGTRLCAWLEALKPSDRLLVLMSGGGSAMIEVPAADWSLGSLAKARLKDLEAGLSIDQINRRAAHRSLIKDGGLARRTACPWRQLTLNDVGDAPDGLVSSGPFLGLDGQDVTIANHQTAADCAARYLRSVGFRVWEGTTLEGEARVAGAQLDLPVGFNALVQSGETTVCGPYIGRGGRNLELVGGWIEATSMAPDWAIVSGASDGLDGSSGAAGAFWSSNDSVDHASLRQALIEHNTAPWFQSAGRLLTRTGSSSHTGDLLVLLRSFVE